MSPNNTSTLVVLPTYNERENIEAIVESILELDPALEIVVVDDSSPDGTGELARELAVNDARVHLIERRRQLGYGTACLDGFKYALQNDYNLILTMDADFSHDPRDIPRLVAPMATSDLANGSRYVEGESRLSWPFGRMLTSFAANTYIRTITGLPVKDATSGFRCLRRQVLESLDPTSFRSKGFSFQYELIYRVWKKDFRISELPINFRRRRKGRSKLSFDIVLEAAWIAWRIRFIDRFGMPCT